jgi:predicted RNA-binding Zn-ribbon protein involved in translation (DUF1610 family)
MKTNERHYYLSLARASVRAYADVDYETPLDDCFIRSQCLLLTAQIDKLKLYMCHYCGLVIIEGCFRCRNGGSALYVAAYVINDEDRGFFTSR